MTKRKTASKKHHKKSKSSNSKTKKNNSKVEPSKIRIKKTKLVVFNDETKRELAMKFASEVHKTFKEMVKATIMFGSQAKNESKPGSDIDVVILIDDASIEWDLELVAWYREELGKIISSQENYKLLHVNTVKITTWWYDLMHGDAVVLNILRYGEALIDFGGFFTPLKALLLQGKIHATPEAVHAALQRAPLHLIRSRQAEASAIEGVYWAMVDSAQAALITAGKLPPSPEHITKMLHETFVESGMLNKDYVAWYRDIFSLHKELTHGKIMDVQGSKIDEWQEKANKFLLKMTQIIDQLIENTKK